MYIEWKETYKVGVKEMDDQHKELLTIINDLHVAQSMGTGRLVITEKLDNLVDYALYHFSTEEEICKQFNYAKAEEHKAEHEQFKEKISSYLNNAESGQLLITVKTIDFLKDWFITHILATDKEFGEYVKKERRKKKRTDK